MRSKYRTMYGCRSSRMMFTCANTPRSRTHISVCCGRHDCAAWTRRRCSHSTRRAATVAARNG
jgi:hypothetical protein